jgi:hypothetical protein
MKKELIRGFSTIMAAAILASIIPACGGGNSGSAGAVPPVIAAPDHKLHVSTPVSGILVVPGGTTVLKTGAFVPDTQNDFIHGIYASCNLTTATAGTATFSLTVQDQFGLFLVNKTGVVAVAGPFSAYPINVSTPILFDVGGASLTFPSPSYTVKFSITTNGVFMGTADNVVLKALVSDNATLVTGSTNWN